MPIQIHTLLFFFVANGISNLAALKLFILLLQKRAGASNPKSFSTKLISRAPTFMGSECGQLGKRDFGTRRNEEH
ncbi:hypothetical protein BD289DRAFT_261878 [Coniella lustricola]|uniref:Uncharacterized protein n=1 Tax=Coniella lustricola TaxID=2025994 RepID=A0A2T3A7T8_9PEZI|nr:hypothetical protein BD289DRAFT_261878 [Coniella lustricola]